MSTREDLYLAEMLRRPAEDPYYVAERAEREAVDRFNNATECECCGAPLGDDRKECDGFIIGDCCARPLAGLALDNLLAQAATARTATTGRWA